MAHPEGVAADLVAGPAGEVDEVEDAVDASGGVGGITGVEAGEQLQVPPAGQVGVEAGAFDESRDPVQGAGAGLRPGPAEYPQGAGVGADEPEQHPQECCFPGAVGAEDAVDLADVHA